MNEPATKFYIEPPSRWPSIGFAELWAYRDLLAILVWRDIKVRYKQTALGALWAILQPVFMMIVFTLFFGRLAKVPSNGLPYSLFAFTGLLPWQLFSHAISESSNSLVSSERLITKVYFPRLLIPLSAVLGGLVDFVVAFAVLLLMIAYYRVALTWTVLTVPFFVLLALVTALAFGLWLSALNVKYRDVKYTIGFLLQFWLFATPVVYPASMVPEKWRPLLGLNPMAGVVEGFRWALLGQPISSALLVTSVTTAILVLVGGLVYFRSMEQEFADIV